jgi:hypothetical protein
MAALDPSRLRRLNSSLAVNDSLEIIAAPPLAADDSLPGAEGFDASEKS